MVSFFKALPFGILLTLLVALFIGSGGSHGGMLNIRHVTFEGIEFYWSWMLFMGGTLLAWAILAIMGD